MKRIKHIVKSTNPNQPDVELDRRTSAALIHAQVIAYAYKKRRVDHIGAIDCYYYERLTDKAKSEMRLTTER